MNMDMPPTGENNQEKIKKETVLEILTRTKSFSDPESQGLVTKWIEQRESEVVSSRDAIVLNIERSELFIAIGEIGEAFKNLEDTLEQADSENEIELQDQIIAKLKSLRASNPELVKKLATFPLLSDSEVTPKSQE